eukprot:60723_1
MDRSTLLNIFEEQEDTDDFADFVNDHFDQFILLVIDIILDPSANSRNETKISTTLFHELRGAGEDSWPDIPLPIKAEIKSKLLTGITDLEGTAKENIFTHIIAIIAAFEAWDELILLLADLSTSKSVKLSILSMVGSWCPDQLKGTHAQPILKAVHGAMCTRLREEDDNEHMTHSLFKVFDEVMNDITDTALIIDATRIAIVFLLKVYVANHEALGLIDSDLNLNVQHIVFDELELNVETPYRAASINLLSRVHGFHFDALPVQLRHELFFVMNVLLKLNAEKMKQNLIYFAPEQSEWDADAWQYAMVAQTVFSILYQMKENAKSYDYYTPYFKRSDAYDCHLIENLVSNINHDATTEAVSGQWSALLEALAKDYAFYFWHKTELFIPVLRMKHPVGVCQDMTALKTKLYHQEWLAVRCFVRHHYSLLYDQLRIPIMEMILKYLSQYVSIGVVIKDAEHGFDADAVWDDRVEIEYDVIAMNEDAYDVNDIAFSVGNQMISKHQKECLIDGFLKTVQLTALPCSAISCVVYAFYPWMLEVFEVYNEEDFDVNKEKTLMTLTKGNVDRTAYGRINIPPTNKDVHMWKFKVISAGQVSIGIDESDCKEVGSSFIAPSETRSHYGYSFSGGRFCLKDNYKPYGSAFGTNDTVVMIFDADQRTLRFYKNDVNQHILADRIDCSKTFKMAVSLCFVEGNSEKDCAVQMIDYQCAKYDR